MTGDDLVKVTFVNAIQMSKTLNSSKGKETTD